MNPSQNLSQHDELLLQRHLDGELDAAANAVFRTRLATEPGLAKAAEAARSLRAGFRAVRDASMRPSPSFTAGVLAAARQLPSRHLLEQADVAAAAAGFCRRILLAAAVLAGLGLLWHSDLVNHPQPATLQAAPGEVQRVIDELDARLQKEKLEPPALPGSRSPGSGGK